MNFFKKPGRILLLIMIVLAVVCPYRVHMYKTKIEEIKSGKLKINDMQYVADDHTSVFSLFNDCPIHYYRSRIRIFILC